VEFAHEMVSRLPSSLGTLASWHEPSHTRRMVRVPVVPGPSSYLGCNQPIVITTRGQSRMIRATLVLVPVLALGACGGTSHSAPTAQAAAAHAKPYVAPATKAPTTSTTVAPSPSNAIALAKALGCPSPTLDPPSSVNIGPKATGEVTCTAHGVALNVSTYAPSGIAFFNSSVGKALICSVATGFGLTGPFYSVVGSDFDVSESGTGGGISIDPNAQAKMQAVADQLGAKIATINCPAAKP
jgi:hypothetical protein